MEYNEERFDRVHVSVVLSLNSNRVVFFSFQNCGSPLIRNLYTLVLVLSLVSYLVLMSMYSPKEIIAIRSVSSEKILQYEGFGEMASK